MNGYAEIKIGKEGEQVVHPLYFGRQAVEEFGRRLANHLSDNSFKIAVDMIFAGIAGYNTKIDVPPIPYPEVYDMVETFHEQEDFAVQYDAISKAFWESKYGRDYQEKLAELKKKVETEIEELKNPTSPKPKKKQRTTGTL